MAHANVRRIIQELHAVADDRVLRRLPEHRRALRRNVRDDVVLYLEICAELLEAQLARARTGESVAA